MSSANGIVALLDIHQKMFKYHEWVKTLVRRPDVRLSAVELGNVTEEILAQLLVMVSLYLNAVGIAGNVHMTDVRDENSDNDSSIDTDDDVSDSVSDDEFESIYGSDDDDESDEESDYSEYVGESESESEDDIDDGVEVAHSSIVVSDAELILSGEKYYLPPNFVLKDEHTYVLRDTWNSGAVANGPLDRVHSIFLMSPDIETPPRVLDVYSTAIASELVDRVYIPLYPRDVVAECAKEKAKADSTLKSLTIAADVHLTGIINDYIDADSTEKAEIETTFDNIGQHLNDLATTFNGVKMQSLKDMQRLLRRGEISYGTLFVISNKNVPSIVTITTPDAYREFVETVYTEWGVNTQALPIYVVVALFMKQSGPRTRRTHALQNVINEFNSRHKKHYATNEM